METAVATQPGITLSATRSYDCLFVIYKPVGTAKAISKKAKMRLSQCGTLGDSDKEMPGLLQVLQVLSRR